MTDLSGLSVIAEVGIGIAGFSGVFVVLSQKGNFSPPERVRLQLLLSSSLGALFLAMIPYALIGSLWSLTTIWYTLAATASVLTVFQLRSLAIVLSIRKEYSDIFPVRVVVLQSTFIFSAIALAGGVFFVAPENRLSTYTAALVMLLTQSIVAFIRLLFYRRD